MCVAGLGMCFAIRYVSFARTLLPLEFQFLGATDLGPADPAQTPEMGTYYSTNTSIGTITSLATTTTAATTGRTTTAVTTTTCRNVVQL